MGLTYWDYIYNPRSDSWEVVSNQAFSTKEVAEEYLKQNQKSQEDIEKIKNWDKISNEPYHENTGLALIQLEKENQQLKEELELKNRTIQAFDNKLRITEQDSKTNAGKIEKLHKWCQTTFRDNYNTSYAKFAKEKDAKFKCAEEVQSILKESE